MAAQSRIEELIEEILNYISECKHATFSNTKIIVEKNYIDELLTDLKRKTPAEIKRYNQIIQNRDSILNDAEVKARALIDEATIHTNELISEHEIMQQAYKQANEVIELATVQAQQILDNATNEANQVRDAAVQYTDDLLGNVENIITQASIASAENFTRYKESMDQWNEVVRNNRIDLYPTEEVFDVDDNLEDDIN